jgi:hypothetical protein
MRMKKSLSYRCFVLSQRGLSPNVEGREREIARGLLTINKDFLWGVHYNYFIDRIKVQGQQTDPQNKLVNMNELIIKHEKNKWNNIA